MRWPRAATGRTPIFIFFERAGANEAEVQDEVEEGSLEARFSALISASARTRLRAQPLN